MKIESTVALVNALVRGSKNRQRVFAEIAHKENYGYCFDMANASLELLIARILNGKKLPFTVKSYHVSMRGSMEAGAETKHICEASVKVIVRGAQYFKVSEGDGPISALDTALRLALGKSFSNLERFRLTDYLVGLVPGTMAGTGAKTRALIVTTDGQTSWRTAGVGTNVVEASLLALVDGLEYALLPRARS